MDTTPTDLPHLFEQLGLDSSTRGISEFIESHKLGANELIWRASFWSPAQAAFLQDALERDDHWSGRVDELTSRLMS